MSMSRRSTYTALVLAAGLLAVCIALAVTFRPGGFAKRDGEAPDVPAGDGPNVAPLPRAVQPNRDPRPLPEFAVARMGIGQRKGLAAQREVITAAYSTDGKVIAAANWTGAANMKGYQLWDADTGEAAGEVPTPIRALFGVSLSPDRKKLAWGGNDGVAVAGVSDVTTGGVLVRTAGGNKVAFTADGKHVVVGGYGSQTVVADAATGKVVHTLSEPDRFANTFALSPDGKTVVASTEKKRDIRTYDPYEARVDVWDVATGKLRKVLKSQPYPFGLKALAVSSDGAFVAFNEQKKLNVVNAATGKALWQLENPGGNHVWEFAAFSPDDKLLFGIRTLYDGFTTTTYDLFDSMTGKLIRTFDGQGYQFNQAAFSTDGKRILTFGESVPVRMWDVATGRLLPEYEGHRAAIQSLAMSGNGGTIISADVSYSLCIWDGSDLRKRFDWRGVRCVSMSADGKLALVTIAGESATLLLEPATGSWRVVTRYQTQHSAISRDGKRAAISRFGDTIDVINLADGKVLCTLKGHTGDLYALAWSVDGTRIISAAKTRPQGPSLDFHTPAAPAPDDTIRVWDAATGKELRRWERAANCAALSADAKVIYAGSEKQIRRLHVETNDELEPLTFHKGSPSALAVSDDGTRAASADLDGIVIWDPRTGRERKRLKPDHGTPTALAFTADGRRLASAGTDGTVLLWNAND